MTAPQWPEVGHYILAQRVRTTSIWTVRGGRICDDRNSKYLLSKCIKSEFLNYSAWIFCISEIFRILYVFPNFILCFHIYHEIFLLCFCVFSHENIYSLIISMSATWWAVNVARIIHELTLSRWNSGPISGCGCPSSSPPPSPLPQQSRKTKRSMVPSPSGLLI